ncbi:cytochrome p450 [Metarhizium guizhouense ARSEF 977]|uniref:Cytochrome p450 n=1 Tax=Metarhizium guizhouense (strain ARSEF 977) TaxID=1276136 RepID=A0A0B4GDF9_METGA|nr:cytochrome p450 [Metarhizium guizhouense ARSEF 977]
MTYYFAVQNRPALAVFSYSRTQPLDSVSSRGNVGSCPLVPFNCRPGFSCLWHTPPVVAAVDVHTKTMDLALGAQIYAILDTLSYFGHTDELYAFTICGVTMYGLSRPEDVTGILDGAPWTHGMDFEHFISEVMQKFGMSPEAVDEARYLPKPGDACYIENNVTNPRHLTLIHFVEDLYKRQFLDPSNLDSLSKVFSGCLQETLQSEKLDFCTRDYNGCLYSIGAPGLRREVSLYSLVAGTMVDATLRSLFGPYLHQVEPDIVDQVIQFNAHAWILFYGLPDFFGLAPVCEPRDRIKAAFRAFVNLPEEQRSEQCFAFKHLLRWMDVLGIDNEPRIGLLFLFFFAGVLRRKASLPSRIFLYLPTVKTSIANEQNACYWFVAHIVYDKELLDIAREEMEPAWQSGELDVKHLTSNCPRLDAIFSETLRQRTNTFGWRVVKEKTVIRGKELQPGTPVIIPMRVLHTNKRLWGVDVDEFDPGRFLNKTTARQPYYRPFASGPTYCPGRVLAKRETYAFLAILLRRFDVTLLEPPASPGTKQAFPLMETQRPPTGVKGPKPGMDLFVRLDELVTEKLI